jgi:hypothetical protein
LIPSVGQVLEFLFTDSPNDKIGRERNSSRMESRSFLSEGISDGVWGDQLMDLIQAENGNNHVFFEINCELLMLLGSEES